MPSLIPEDQVRLLRFEEWTCSKCSKHPYKNYCRQCDEFFWECDCEPGKDEVNSFYKNDHRGHRTY